MDAFTLWWNDFSSKFYNAFIKNDRWLQYLEGVQTTILVTALALALVTWLSLASIMAGSSPWLSLPAIVVVAGFQALVPAFHSRFGCTPWQLIRNTWFMLFAHPLRSLLLTALVWVPVALFLVDTYIFMTCAPIWMAVYFSGAFSLSSALLKKPFKVLVDHFNETHGITPEEHQPSENAVFTDVTETEEEE